MEHARRCGEIVIELKRARVLLRVRTLEDDLAKNVWALSRRETIEAESALESANNALLAHGQAPGVISAGAFRATRDGIQGSLRKRAELRHDLTLKIERESETMLGWQAAKQKREGSQRLVDKVNAATRQAALLAEQNLADDVTSSRWGRR